MVLIKYPSLFLLYVDNVTFELGSEGELKSLPCYLVHCVPRVHLADFINVTL